MLIPDGFSPMLAVETKVLGFNFIRDLPAGDLVNGVVGWYMTVDPASEAADATPSARLSGVPTHDSVSITSQRVINLQPGVLYIIEAVVTTTGSDTLELRANIYGDVVR